MVLNIYQFYYQRQISILIDIIMCRVINSHLHIHPELRPDDKIYIILNPLFFACL